MAQMSSVCNQRVINASQITGGGRNRDLTLSMTPTLSPPPVFTNSSPTGQVRNGVVPTGFNVTNGLPPTDPNFKSGPSSFIFATEDGTISGWSPTVDATHSIIAVDKSAIPTASTGALNKGLAL